MRIWTAWLWGVALYIVLINQSIGTTLEKRCGVGTGKEWEEKAGKNTWYEAMRNTARRYTKAPCWVCASADPGTRQLIPSPYTYLIDYATWVDKLSSPQAKACDIAMRKAKEMSIECLEYDEPFIYSSTRCLAYRASGNHYWGSIRGCDHVRWPYAPAWREDRAPFDKPLIHTLECIERHSRDQKLIQEKRVPWIPIEYCLNIINITKQVHYLGGGINKAKIDMADNCTCSRREVEGGCRCMNILPLEWPKYGLADLWWWCGDNRLRPVLPFD